MTKLFAVLLLSWTLVQGAAPPTLTELQKARLEAAVFKMESAQYRVREAERARDAATDAFQKLFAEYSRTGYDLDPISGVYHLKAAKEGR